MGNMNPSQVVNEDYICYLRVGVWNEDLVLDDSVQFVLYENPIILSTNMNMFMSISLLSSNCHLKLFFLRTE